MNAAVIASALLLAGGGTAPVAPPAELRHFVTDDMQVEYSRSRDARGAVVLTGRETKSGRAFRFKVAKGWVTGDVDGQRVMFHVSELERDAARSGAGSRGR